MKKTARMILALVLALVMLLSLAACNETQNPPETQGKDNKPAETQGKDKETQPAEPELGLLDPYPETVTLTFSRLTDHLSTYPAGVTNDNNAWVKMIKDELNIECVTAYEANTGEDYDRLTSLAIAGDNLPDFLYVYGNGTGSGMSLVKELYENDMIMSIEELYEQYCPDVFKEAYDSYGDVIWEHVTFDGERYGLPYCAGNWNYMFWIRSDWVEELGLPLDTDGDQVITRDELVMVAKAFVENDMSGTGNTVGLALPDAIDLNFNIMVNHLNCFPTNYMPTEDGNVIHGSTMPEMKDGLAWLRGLYEEGLLDPQYGTRTKDDINTLLFNGQLGIVTSSWSFGGVRKAIHEMDPEADFLCYSIDNGTGKVNFPSSLIHKDQFLVVSKNCEHPEALFKILAQRNAYNELPAEEKQARYPELYEQNAAGMSGQARPVFIEILNATYIYDNQTLPVLQYLEDGTIAEGFDPETNTYMRAYKTYHEDPTKMDSMDWVYYINRFAGGAAHGHKLNTEGKYEMLMPIYNQTDSMTSNPVDFDGMCAEYFIKIITGELPLDAFDEYVAERNAQGDAAICEELKEIIN